MTRNRLYTLLLCTLTALLAAGSIPAGESPEATPAETPNRVLPVTGWLRLGPVTTPMPAFHDADSDGFAASDILDLPSLEQRDLWPAAGDRTPLHGHSKAEWTYVDGNTPLARNKELTSETWHVVYLQTDRWLEADLKLAGSDCLRAWLDGEKLSLKTDDEAERPTSTASMKLARGKHLLLLHLVDAPADSADAAAWSIEGEIGIDSELPAEALTITTRPDRMITIEDIVDAPRFGSLTISPDGQLVAVSLSEYDSYDKRDSWLEVRDTRDGDVVASWRGGLNPADVQWAPTGHRLSYTSHAGDKTTIWVRDLDTGSTKAILAGIENFGRFAWAPDGSFLIYSCSVEAEDDPRRVKRVRNPADRQPWFRNRSFLVQVVLPDGAARRLTAGPLDANSWQISPNGRELLFFRGEPDMSARPYSTSEFWVMNLRTLETTMLLDDRWIDSAAWGPDPDLLALGGSPSAFDGLGRNLPDGIQANDYGGQLFLYNRRTGHIEACSIDFTPAIGSFVWSRHDGRIYARCTSTQYSRLFAFDPDGQDWTEVDTDLDFVADFDIAEHARRAVVQGSSATQPFRLMSIDLKRNTPRQLLDPGAEHYRHVDFGQVESWTCELPRGGVLDGFVYYPPNFDPAGTYPLIVYYYGGTSPVTRDFGGRYPKNVWAGQGYIVYVPEPSGATGYGQEFASRHVNDWGRLTADEVIEGTKLFLAAHPAADRKHVGCIGASYGGFLTEYIITRTDIFAAAVSHAGISSLSSYWGEGLWGYAYGARALANTFPWSDRELYVEQSPLFFADRIKTPLLLVHGEADTNVPKGESDQLFTALKILGREVEYVLITGQNHHILDHEQRVVWNDTILAFFARWLKERDEWWTEMYPD